MPFNADPKQQVVRDTVRAFAEKEIYPFSKSWDRMPEPIEFPYDTYRKLGEAGFVGYSTPVEHGGRGKSNLEFYTVIEELAYSDTSVGLICAVGKLTADPILFRGTEEQKRKFVPDCVSGRKVPCFALTELNAGSDAANVETTAVDNGSEYLLTGEKILITHGDVAGLAVVFCRIQGQPKLSAMIVETDQPGWRSRTLRYKMGMRAATTGAITMENVKVPRENLLGEEGEGFRIAMMTMDGARVGVAAQALGVAQRALDESVAYSKERIAFGAPIAKLQAIQWMIADMSTRLEAARLLTYKAAALLDQGAKASLEASQAKLYAAEVANFCVDRAMQVHGGYGYIGEFSVIEKLYRDQRLLEIGDGTSEIQRMVIAGNILGR